MRHCATGRSPWTRRTTSWGPSVARILSLRWSPTFSLLSVAKHVRRCYRLRANCPHASTPRGWWLKRPGIFAGFLDDAEVELIGVEAGGLGLHTGQHAARLAQHVGRPGVAQGYKTCLQNAEGQMQPTHSVAAGLDYIGVGPILAYLHQIGRIRVEAATDAEVLEAFKLVMRREGIIPALESAHAFVTALKEAPQLSPMRSFSSTSRGAETRISLPLLKPWAIPAGAPFCGTKSRRG